MREIPFKQSLFVHGNESLVRGKRRKADSIVDDDGYGSDDEFQNDHIEAASVELHFAKTTVFGGPSCV